MISAALTPAQSRLGTFSIRDFEPGTRVGIVEGDRLAIAHDLLAADKNMPHGALSGGIDPCCGPDHKAAASQDLRDRRARL